MEETNKICPFVAPVVPGKTVNTIQVVRPPCAQEKCALWMKDSDFFTTPVNCCAFYRLAVLIGKGVNHE